MASVVKGTGELLFFNTFSIFHVMDFYITIILHI